MDKYVELRDVKKIYKMGEVEIAAANGIDFYVNKGEFAVVVDESGTMAYHPYDEVFDIMQEVSELRKSIPLEDTVQGMQMNM